MLHQYLLSDSLVRRIIVPTTCCTRLVPRAGDLLLHRSFSSIYLKRQTDVASWKRRHEEEAHPMLAANNQGRRASQSILRMSGAACTRALKNTMTRSDRDMPPVIRGLFGHKYSRGRYCGGGLSVYFSGADAWLVCVSGSARRRSMFPCCAVTHFVCCSQRYWIVRPHQAEWREEHFGSLENNAPEMWSIKLSVMNPFLTS